MGRPKIPLDAEQIEKLAEQGCSAEEIAYALTPKGRRRPWDHQTIERRFHTTIQRGRTRLHRALKRELVKRAFAGDTVALIFCAKCWLGMKEYAPAPSVSVNVSANATAVVKSPEEVKAHLLQLQKAIREEAKRTAELN